jgi:hypothetical protein
VDDFCKDAQHGGLGVLSDDEFMDLAREVEAIRRQLATVDYPILAEVEARSLPEAHLTRNTAGFLRQLWRLSPHEASTRVREAAALGDRAALSGEVLEPLRPLTAAAPQSGVLSGSQVAIIGKTLDTQPDSQPGSEVDAAEATLVDAAHVLDPSDLAKVARHLLDVVDPDGTPPSEQQIRRRRDLWLRKDKDGMIRFGGTLDPAAGARAEAWIGAHAKPRPDDATGRDERTPGQRRHDAFAELLGLGLRAGEFATATATGSPATVHICMTAEQFVSGTGHVTTSYGQQIQVRDAFRLLDQACIAWAVHNSKGGILNYGRTRRLASKEQAEALLLRDGGCAFPGCDHPAEWCERHHVTEWQHGGETSIDNLVLLCAYHHARFAHQGWQIITRSGVPWFIPPPLIDPDQKPIRNIRGLGANPFNPGGHTR